MEVFSTKPLLLLNTLTQVKEPFIPKNPRDVRVYCCGPTVYDEPHLGHAKTYIFFDILCRFLRHCKHFDVRSVMNITDYDDKIITKGGLSIAQKYEKIFFDTMDKLNVLRPDFTPRASEFFREAENFVEGLRKRGYVQPDNRFDVQTCWKNYGVAFTKNQKRQPPKEGFLVWKDKDYADLRQTGKPGWHTECAAINAYYFGDSIDLHVGGIDLQFPHHENEIALGRVLFDKTDWIRYTLHTGHLEIEGKKMSKSEKNFITLQDMLDKNYSPLAIRYFFMKYPYGNPIHFKEQELKNAQNSYDQFILHLGKLKDFLNNGENEPQQKPKWEELFEFKTRLENCLLDNLNVSRALQLLEDYVKTTLPTIKNKSWLQYCLKYVIKVCDEWLGLIKRDNVEDLDSFVRIIKEFRSEMREKTIEQLRLCDKLRKELNMKGFITEDEPISK